MTYKTHYITTDLELAASQDLTPLADVLAQRGFITYNIVQHEDNSWSARFRTEEGFEEPDQNIAAILTIIEALDEVSRSLWERCILREFDIGYECGDEPKTFVQHLTTETLSRIARAGVAVRITLYPTSSDDDPGSCIITP